MDVYSTYTGFPVGGVFGSHRVPHAFSIASEGVGRLTAEGSKPVDPWTWCSTLALTYQDPPCTRK